MRFKRVELSPANKRQYLLALGKRDLELLLGEAISAYEHYPRTPDHQIDRRRLLSIVNGLQDALKQCEQDGDEGEKLHRVDRQKYQQVKDELEQNPLHEITRLEVVDHTPCKECKGEMWIVEEGQPKPFPCKECGGLGVPGRTVVFWDEGKKVQSMIQDEGRTLKMFVSER